MGQRLCQSLTDSPEKTSENNTNQVRKSPSVWVGNNLPMGEVAVEVIGVFSRLRPLLPIGWLTKVTGFLPGHSGVQLKIIDRFLDPGLTGVSTNLPASSGLKAIKIVEGLITH